MPSYEFTLQLDQEVSDAQADAIYDACTDATIETGVGRTEIGFTREAPTWADAIGSAIRDVDNIPGLLVTGAGQDELVSMREIAHRTRRSREAVRLWAVGERGPGSFPAPAWQSPAGERFWSWPDVARWVRKHLNLAVDVAPDEIRWADEILKARLARREAQRILRDANEAARRQFGPLLDCV